MRTIYEEFRALFDNQKPHDGFCIYSQNTPETTSFPQRIKRSLEVVNPTALLIFNDKPVVLFFDKSHLQNKEAIFKKCWNFSESPIVIIETETDYEIYDGFRYILEDGNFSLVGLDNDKEKITYLSLISGEYFKNHFPNKTEKHIDKLLLKNITYARDRLIESLQSTNKLSIANALIGRIIFIRYLIDREVSLLYEGKKRLLTNDDLKAILSDKEKTYRFFKDLQSEERGFNGDWFPVEADEEACVDASHLQILKELISGTDIKSGQRSLFDIYDFSIIPIEFISNVYERFIGEKKQKKDGAYYTPAFLVDYILKHTVEKYFKDNPNTYNCKVLDPACGSGIFLVETFRKLVQQYEKVTGKKADENTIKQIVKDNIFGIDYNKSALQVAVFSLYLAMLDYQDPKDIENFKFPYLTKENPNFFENDFFDIDAVFNILLKEKNIDFIIGNPPYGRGTVKTGSFADRYIKKEKLSIGNRDVVQPFMVRVKDFCDLHTQVSFIVTSKVLYNLQSEAFRTKNFFNHFKIKHILELSSVRKEIFENATTPVSILFYKPYRDKEVLNNTFSYISLKPSPYFEKLKLLLISKNDFKKVSQKNVLEFDYLWKILVYGSYLDFNLIKRLKGLDKVENHISEISTGIKVGNKSHKVPKDYLELNYITTKHILPFYLRNSNYKINEKYAEGIRTKKTFLAPSILVSLGIKSDLDYSVALLHKNSLFPASITSAKSKNKNIDYLYNIMGLFKSNIFRYFIFLIGSSIGIEREQIHNPEKFSMPFVYNKDIVKITKQIEKLQKEHFDGDAASIFDYESKLQNLIKSLNNAVLKTFDLSDQELALVDFAVNITIPWIMQKKYDVAFSPYEYKDKRLEAYVKLFTDHYSAFYEEQGVFFQATMYWSRYAIGIYFKTSKEKPTETIVWKKEEHIRHFLDLDNGKKLANLFIQKDIKGFEKDGFYVVKPNEIKNWHKAIGYLDLYEFEDAILRAGQARWKR